MSEEYKNLSNHPSSRRVSTRCAARSQHAKSGVTRIHFTHCRKLSSLFVNVNTINDVRITPGVLRIGQDNGVFDFRDRSRIMKTMAKKRKNPYAVALGRKGGRKGGPARAANMTPEQRSESARNAVTARWAKVKQETEC